jgi:ATPase subunit of ABC transporter with duplicated ATPase domains
VAKPLSFKDFIAVDYSGGYDEYIAHRIKRRRRSIDTSEALSLQGRRALARAMKRNKAKIKMGRKRAAQKTATQSKIVNRSQRQARNILFKKITKGMSRGDLSPARRKEIEKKVAMMKGKVSALARKIMPDVRKADRKR